MSLFFALFTEKELFEAVSQMKRNKAPGSDGFLAEFYKNIIKGDLVPTFQDLFNGHLQIFHLNFGTLTLLPNNYVFT